MAKEANTSVDDDAGVERRRKKAKSRKKIGNGGGSIRPSYCPNKSKSFNASRSIHRNYHVSTLGRCENQKNRKTNSPQMNLSACHKNKSLFQNKFYSKGSKFLRKWQKLWFFINSQFSDIFSSKNMHFHMNMHPSHKNAQFVCIF